VKTRRHQLNTQLLEEIPDSSSTTEGFDNSSLMEISEPSVITDTECLVSTMEALVEDSTMNTDSSTEVMLEYSTSDGEVDEDLEPFFVLDPTIGVSSDDDYEDNN